MHSERTNLRQLTGDLIRFKSIDVPEHRDELHRIIAFVAARFKGMRGVYMKHFAVHGKPGLVVTFEKSQKKPTLFLNGHLDVVHAEAGQFSPKIKGNKIYGRGAHDMKGACAVMIALIEYFAKQKEKPSAGCMFVTDEEAYGDESRTLFQLGYHPKLLITLEPTNLDLMIETKGIVWMEGTIHGKAAHGSMPWLGRNPVEDFHRGLRAFYTYFPTLVQEQWKTTANIGEVRSGDCYNRIPPDLTFKIDIRYIAKDNPRLLIERVKRSFPKYTTWNIKRCDPPHRRAKDMTLIRRLKKVTEDLRMSTRYGRAPFATDARFFSEGGINCAVFGATGGGMHGADEWVDLTSLEKLFNALTKFCNTISL